MKLTAVPTCLGLVLLLAGPAAADPLEGVALAEVTGSVVGNSVTTVGPLSTANTLDQAYDGAVGISVVQQNNGDNNLMSAAVSVVDLSETVANLAGSSRAMVHTIVSGNTAAFDGGPAVRSNVISGAFNGASGVMIVQQNNGHNNAISAAVAVSGNGGLASLALIP